MPIDPDDPATWPGAIVTLGTGKADAAPPRPPSDPGDAATWPGAVADKPSLDTFGERLRQGTSAAVHGLAGLPGLLYDAAALPQNLAARLTGIEALRARPAHERIGQALEAAGLPAQPERSLPNLVIENLAGVPTAGAAGGLLGRLGAAAEQPVLAGVGETLQRNLPAQLGAGAGAGLAQATVPDDPYAQLGAGLLGAAAGGGLVQAAQGARSLLGSTAARDWQAGLRRYVELGSDRARVVGEGLGIGLPPAEPPYGPPTAAEQEAAGHAIRPVQLGPDGRPATPADAVAAMDNQRTTGELLADPGLLRAEATARNSAGLRGGFEQRDAARRDLRGSVLDTIAPPSADPAAVRAPIAATADQAAADLAAARGQLGPASPGAVTGPALQEAFNTQRGASRAAVRDLADAVDPNNEITVPTAAVRTALRGSIDRYLPNVTPDGYPAPIADLMTGLSGRSLTYQQFRDLKQGASEASRSADPRTAMVLGDVIGSAEAGQPGYIDQHLAANLPPDALARHNAYLAAARVQGNRFAGPIAKSLDARDYGRPGEDLQSTIPGMFFRPASQGGVDTMQAFGRYFRDPAGQLAPQAADAMRRHVADQLAGLADPLTGEVNARAHAAWLADHAGPLRAVPELGLYDRVRNVSEATRLAGEAGAAGVRPIDQPTYGGNVARTILGAPSVPDAVRQILAGRNAPAAMRDAVGRLDPAGVEALRREALDQFAAAGRTDTPDFSGAAGLRQSGSTRWLTRNQPALAELFDPAELGRIQAVHDNIWSQAQVRARMALSGSDTQPKLSNAQALAGTVFGEGDPTLGRELAGQMVDRLPYVGSVMRGLREAGAGRAMGRVYDLARDPELFGALLRQADPQTLGELAGTVRPPTGWRRAGAALDALRGRAAEVGRPALPALTNPNLRP